MTRELTLPRESVVDLALLLEEALQQEDESWRTDDQVMDLHLLKRRLKEQEEQLDAALARVRLQGTALVMTAPQKRELRREAVALAGVCLAILQVAELLDPELDI